MIYFRDGKEVQRERGSKEMKDLSKWVEELLETIRPGSRKEGGPKLPKAGDKAVEAGPDKEEIVKEKVKDEVKDKEAASSKLESLKNEPTKEPSKAATPTPTPAKATPVKAISTYNPSGISEPKSSKAPSLTLMTLGSSSSTRLGATTARPSNQTGTTWHAR